MQQPDPITSRGSAYPQLSQRTEKILTPDNWMREMPGGWLFYTGAAPPGDGTNIELFARGDHPERWGVPEWVVYLLPEPGDSPILHNPVTFEGPDEVKHEFWPDCIEDLQALLLQVGRYGYAQPVPGGWEVTATVTAAAARAAAADGNNRHTVNRNDDNTEWVFTTTGTPVPLAREPSSPPTAPDHPIFGIFLNSDNTETTPQTPTFGMPSAEEPARSGMTAAKDSRGTHAPQPGTVTHATTTARSSRPGTPGARHGATNPPHQGRAR